MADPHPLDAATALDGAPDDAVRHGRTSDRYWTFISPFGGTSAATALRAVLEHPARQGDPLAATVNFCAPIAKGAQVAQLEVRVGDGAPGRLPLYAGRAVGAAGPLDRIVDGLRALFS